MLLVVLCVAAAGADTIPELIHRGDAALDAGRFDDAIRVYSTVLERQPGHATARVRIGIAYSKMNRLDDAEVQFGAVIADKPDCDEAWHNLGLLRLKQGRIDKAREALERTLAITDYYPQANFHLGLIAEMQGEIETARQRYLAEVNANPRCLGAWDRLEALGQRSARRISSEQLWLAAGAMLLLAAAIAWVGRHRLGQRSSGWA